MLGVEDMVAEIVLGGINENNSSCSDMNSVCFSFF